MAFPARAYALASQDLPPAKRENVVPIRREETAEMRAKRAIDRANKVLDRIEARIEEYKYQIEVFKRGLKILATRKERIEDEILQRMSAAGVEHVDGIFHEFSAVPCPAAVAVDDESQIPKAYMRTPKTPKDEPDKVAIRSALERDKDLIIPGVHLTQGVRLARK